MTSCTIIISHYESIPFLRACVRQIRKYKHPEIEQTIIVADQSRAAHSFIDDDDFWGTDLFYIRMNPLYSGYGIDYLMRKDGPFGEYICQLHVDAFPIHKNWLYLPIKLIEEYNLAFVGQLHFISNGSGFIYPPNPFFSMSPTFNVARTETYIEMSLQAGFTRFHNRPDSGLSFKNKDWDNWAAADYAHRGSDDDTVAFCWEDSHREHDKLGLAITGMIDAPYGRIIEDIVFHFGSCREAIGVMGQMSQEYQQYTQRINGNYSDELISEMVERAKATKPPAAQILTRNLWDGKLKESMPPFEELNKRIEELKK